MFPRNNYQRRSMPRRRDDVIRTPRAHRFQRPKPKQAPIPPKECVVYCQIGEHPKYPQFYDAHNKILFFDPAQGTTVFPSRRQAKAAVYWTVMALAEADGIDPVELWGLFSIENAVRAR